MSRCDACIHSFELKPGYCSCGQPGTFRKDFGYLMCENCYCEMLLIRELMEGAKCEKK